MYHSSTILPVLAKLALRSVMHPLAACIAWEQPEACPWQVEMGNWVICLKRTHHYSSQDKKIVFESNKSESVPSTHGNVMPAPDRGILRSAKGTNLLAEGSILYCTCWFIQSIFWRSVF